MLALPPLSGEELVALLERLGFRTKARSAGLVTLCRRAHAVVVPQTTTLAPALVGALLRAANVEPVDFLRVLARATSRLGATSASVVA